MSGLGRRPTSGTQTGIRSCEEQFVRIHKSAAVNVMAIRSFTPLFKGDYEVLLRNGRTLRLSRRYKDALFARMGQ